MKIQIKFAAVAVITAVALFSCGVPEVETPKRNSKEVYAQYNPAQVGGTGSKLDYLINYGLPTIDNDDLEVSGTTDKQKELTVNFPPEADVLRKSTNAEIESELKKFLSFWTFTNPTGSTTFGRDYSTLGSAEATTYTVVSRVAGVNKTRITIRLATVPTSNLVAKFNDKFTYSGGYKVNLANPDAGSPVYGDFYLPIWLNDAPGSGPIAINDTFYSGYDLGYWGHKAGGHQNWYSTVYDIYDGTFTAPATQVAVGAFFIGNIYSGSDPVFIAEVKKIYEEFIPKIELQKLDGSKWVKDSTATIKYLDNTDPLFPSGGDVGLYAVFTPSDLTAYRVAANGVANLQTSGEYYGQKQKISVGSFSHPATYFHDTVVGQPGWYYDPDKNVTGNFSTYIVGGPTGFEITSDKNGLNVVLKIRFDPIPADDIFTGIPAAESWLKETIDLATFKKYFKIAGSNASGITGTGFDDPNIYFVGIKKVETRSRYTDAAAKRDELVITLDPSYRYNSSGDKTLFIGGLDFQLFSDSKVFFGDLSNWKYAIDGVRHWNQVVSGLVF